jgi:ribonuclease III
MSKKRKLDTSLEGETPSTQGNYAHCRIPPLPTQAPASLKSPQISTCPKPVACDEYPNKLPKLPEILDKSLESVTFTHQGTLTARDVNDVNMSYERLEFLGDAYLELIASRYVFPRFPNLNPGQLSQRRQLLVNNETLADFSQAYGFDTRAHLPHDIHLNHAHGTGKTWTKTMGDIFEAYVAAVIVSDPDHGFSKVEAWMTELWGPVLSNREEEKLNMNAKVQLSTRIGGKGVKVTYRDEKEPERNKKDGKILFHIGVYVSGWGYEDAHLASGQGWNKNEAGNRAATHAMSMPLTAKMAAIKREFDMKVAQERKQKPDI